MRHLVPVVVLVVLGASGASAQDRGVLAIGVESARHAFRCRGRPTPSTCAGPPTARWWRRSRRAWRWRTRARRRGGSPCGPGWRRARRATRSGARRTNARMRAVLACSVLNVVCLADAGSGNASAAPLAATAEQENLFWQSVMNSTNPAMFEAYLAQFPSGVFRALAEARLAELRAPADNVPGGAVSRAPADNLPEVAGWRRAGAAGAPGSAFPDGGRQGCAASSGRCLPGLRRVPGDGGAAGRRSGAWAVRGDGWRVSRVRIGDGRWCGRPVHLTTRWCRFVAESRLSTNRSASGDVRELG